MNLKWKSVLLDWIENENKIMIFESNKEEKFPRTALTNRWVKLEGEMYFKKLVHSFRKNELAGPTMKRVYRNFSTRLEF